MASVFHYAAGSCTFKFNLYCLDL